MSPHTRLDDKYTAQTGRVFFSGTQAFVRLPMVQMRHDRSAGRKTAAFVFGYRGSPLGGLDMELQRAKRHLEALDVTVEHRLNAGLAATALWGTQQVGLSRGATHDGVAGIW